MVREVEIDVQAVNDAQLDSGVTGGTELLRFVDAVMKGDEGAVATARNTLYAKLGDAGVVDAAAVILMFNVVDRIADATGIAIDAGVGHDSRYQIGRELGMDHLTPEARSAR